MLQASQLLVGGLVGAVAIAVAVVFATSIAHKITLLRIGAAGWAPPTLALARTARGRASLVVAATASEGFALALAVAGSRWGFTVLAALLVAYTAVLQGGGTSPDGACRCTGGFFDAPSRTFSIVRNAGLVAGAIACAGAPPSIWDYTIGTAMAGIVLVIGLALVAALLRRRSKSARHVYSKLRPRTADLRVAATNPDLSVAGRTG